ncbi:hypothetical protein ML462_00160 [Gramella lutea]|uniref:Uncharacterized protein n=1 Tax=Christiangramia lutea TaxID=1607951 RepID=A0A9X1V0V1_9FLAO|nr:hypothetical protein [Christiangramia lutea]MCH4821571.1 hypothetical protein [Christiangramia lutea]
MKRFLKYLILIILFTYGLMYFLDLIYTELYRNGHPRNKLQNELKLKDQHYDIGFYGSSRIERHINCELIEKLTGKTCVNLGFAGANLADMKMLAEINKSNGVTFDTIFFQIDYNYNFENYSPYFLANLAPYLDEAFVEHVFSKRDEYGYYKWIPFYKYMRNEKVLGVRELISVLLQTKNGRNTNIGYRPLKGVGLAVRGKFPDSLKHQNSKVIGLEKLYPSGMLYFFTAPYCQNIQNREISLGLAGKIKNYRNYHDLFDNNAEYFYDCGHLNDKGAEAFTEQLIFDYNF